MFDTPALPESHSAPEYQSKSFVPPPKFRSLYPLQIGISQAVRFYQNNDYLPEIVRTTAAAANTDPYALTSTSLTMTQWSMSPPTSSFPEPRNIATIHKLK